MVVSVIDLSDHAKEIKNMSFDRIIVLKPREGQSTLNSKGMVDNRLFDGNNRLHAIRDSQTAFWSLRYDKGLVPEQMKQSFTTFQKMYDFVKGYFGRRNVDVVDVIDA